MTSTDLTRAQSLQQLTDFESQFQNDMKKIQSDQQTTNSFSAELLELVRLQLQFAVAKYLCGNRIRIESEIAADNEVDQVIGESQKMLLTAIEQLKKIKTYLAAQQNPTFSDQINSLSNEVDLYLYLAEISHALTIAQDNNRYAEAVLKSEKLNTQAQQRGAVVQGRSLPPIPAPVYNKLGQVAASLDEWSKKKLEFYSRKFDLSNLKVPELLRDGYYLVLRARVELAACYRIMQKFDKSSAVLNSQELKLDLEGAMLPEDLRLRIAAERIRFLTAIANSATINNPAIKDAEKSAWDISNLSALSVSVSADNLDYCLAKLELGLFLAGRKNVTDSSTEFMIITDVLKVIRQMELKIPSSGYCAAVVISSNKITPSKINNTRFDAIRTTVLGELAQNKNDRDQIMEAVKLYELAGRVAEVAGDKETATKNIQYSISSLYKLLKQLEASRQNAAQISEQNQQYWNDRVFRCRLLVVKMLCGWAVRFVGERISVEWYQRGIDEATILFKAKQLKLDDYIAILSGYVLRWENASDCAAYRLRAANLLEFNGRFDEALTFLDKIPNNSDRAMEAVTAADRCFKQIYNKNKTNLNDDERINVTINELNWFRRRLRDDVSEWSEADAVTAIKMAERLFYRNGTPIFYWETVDDKLLRNVESALVEAADKCKTALPVTIARLKMMLIIAYNLQGNHVKSAELVKQIVDVQAQLLTESERLFLRRFEVEGLA
ncbi:MAG: hypothetical protein LBK06_09970, partial [Planctomycetaceae bacterium]|nr:hypothetical protein [Planctomycetaceae bacterium]